MTLEDAGAPPQLPDPPVEPAVVLPDEVGSSEEAVAVEATAVLPVAAPPSIADGIPHPLDPRRIRLQRIVGLLTGAVIAFVLLGGLAIVLAAAPLLGWVTMALVVLWAGFSVGLFWLTWRWPVIEHRHSFYRVDDRGIEIRRGVFWRQVIHVPRSRVQHTDVSQGPLERTHGLGTLVIYTAGTDHAKVDLGGLSHETALAIRDHLLSGSGGGDAV